MLDTKGIEPFPPVTGFQPFQCAAIILTPRLNLNDPWSGTCARVGRCVRTCVSLIRVWGWPCRVVDVGALAAVWAFPSPFRLSKPFRPPDGPRCGEWFYFAQGYSVPTNWTTLQNLGRGLSGVPIFLLPTPLVGFRWFAGRAIGSRKAPSRLRDLLYNILLRRPPRHWVPAAGSVCWCAVTWGLNEWDATGPSRRHKHRSLDIPIRTISFQHT